MSEGITATPRLSPQAAAAATAPVATPVVLVELDFASGPIRAWTGLGPLHWAGVSGRPLLRVRPRPAGGGDPAAGQLMARLLDWHDRLAALLAAVETRPFDAHRWNCGQFALAAIYATTGRRPTWRSLTTLEATADSAGFPRIPPAFARAGDVVLAGDQPRLGVVVDGGPAPPSSVPVASSAFP